MEERLPWKTPTREGSVRFLGWLESDSFSKRLLAVGGIALAGWCILALIVLGLLKLAGC